MKLRIQLKDSDKELGHTLYKRDLWTQDIDYIINANIYEYDMKNAGLNLIKYYELLDDQTIEYLEDMPKHYQTIEIGNLMKENKFLNRELTQAFSKMRKKFLLENNIKEQQILAIKRDAIFLVNKSCEITKFRNVEFVLKNKYTSFHRFSNMEFFYRNKGKVLNVKGIDDNKLVLHEDYMCKFLKDVFNLLETSSNERVVSKLKQFAKFYKSKQLDVGYYRELNAESYFSLNIDGDKIIKTENYLTGFDIDISFNYLTFILPLIQRFFMLKV